MRNLALHLTGRPQGEFVGSAGPSPGNQIRRSTAEWLFEALLFSAVQICVGLLGHSLSLVNGQLMLVWPAVGVALAGLWLRGTSLWPAVWLGGFLADFYHFGSPVFSSVAGVGNTLGVLVAVTLLERWGFSARLERAPHVFQLIGAGLCGAVVSGLFGSASMALSGMLEWNKFSTAFFDWACADGLGCMCVAPLLLTWVSLDAKRPPMPRQLELLALGVAYFVAEAVVAKEFGPLGTWGFVQAYLPFPFLLCAAVRGGPPGAAAAVFGLAMLTAWRCVDGISDPWQLDRIGSLPPVSLFVAVSSMTALLVSAYHQENTQATEALARSEAEARKLAIVAARTQHGVAICDAERRIEWCNPALRTLTGLASEMTMGRPLETLLALQFSNGQIVADAVRKLQLGLGMQLEGWCVRADGHRYWAEIDVEPIESDIPGGPRRWSLVQRDGSDRQEAHAALQTAKEAAEAAYRAKTEFLANMSHEIRTPMTAIVGYADMLARDEEAGAIPAGERRQALDAMNRNGKHLLAMVDDMLELSNAELGRTALIVVPFYPAKLVDEVVESFRAKAESQKLDLLLSCDSSTPLIIGSDTRCVRQILKHLIANAIKFTEVGGVRIRVSSPAEGCLQVVVADSGVGLSSERAAGLFQPFFQADGSMSRRFGGAGLGLAVSKRLAKLLGGDVTVDSRAGQGSTFTFTMRFDPRVCNAMTEVDVDKESDTVDELVAQVDTKVESTPGKHDEPAPGPPKPYDQTIETRKPDLVGLRVLLAEDGLDNQRLLSAILRKAGAEVALAENGAEAIHAAVESERSKMPFDIVLMDMQMPTMDGYEATRTLKKNGYPRPIMALTAHAMKGDDERCYAAGCDAYATKPITRVELIAAVKRVLARPSKPANT